MPLAHRETVTDQGVEAALLDVGEGHIELLRPLGEDTPVGKFVARRARGMHHVAYAVEDIDATLAQIKEAGLELIDSEPRTGIRGSRVAFLHPALDRRRADRDRRARRWPERGPRKPAGSRSVSTAAR